MFNKKIKTISLKNFLLLFFGTILIIFLGALLFNGFSSINLMKTRIIADSESTTSLFSEHMLTELERVDTYLYTSAMYDYDFNRLAYMEDESAEWYNTLEAIRNKLNNASYLYAIDALFCYKPTASAFVFGSNNGFLFNDTKEITKLLLNDKDKYDRWTIIKYNNYYYLSKVFENRGLYFGAVIKTDSLLNSFLADNSYLQGLYFSDDNERMLYRGNDLEIAIPDDAMTNANWVGIIDKKELLMVKHHVTDSIYLWNISSMADIRRYYRHLVYSVIGTLILIALVWIFITILMKKMILNPALRLTNALKEVGKGNLTPIAKATSSLEEFITIRNVYNDMITQIKDLKIDAYEQKIEHQKLETQYLKQQIAPHFMINCLNTAYQLTEFGELELSKKMLRSLSDHLRYILSSRQKVSLSEELKLVQNYIEMSKIRYPESIEFNLTVDELSKDSTVVPLLILNFIENTIKHNAVMGRKLTIDVDARSEDPDFSGRLYIVIKDSGKGFNKEALLFLKNIDTNYIDNSSHIGIQNTILRAKDALPTTLFQFYNDEENGGAVIKIDMPYRRFVQ